MKPISPPVLELPLPGSNCREISGKAIQALLSLIDEIAVDGKVDQMAVHKIAQAILAAEGPLAAAYAHREQKCAFAFHRTAIECQRVDILGRLIIRPIEELLDQPDGLERQRVGQLLTTIRMLVGEEDHEVLRADASTLGDAHRGADGFVDWDEFYADAEGGLILERVLVALAHSFRRFDPRRDWFLTVMNANPAAVSVASNAFVPLKPEDRAKFAFTEAHMATLFDVLFDSVKPNRFTGDRLRAFSRRWNAVPEKLFGPLFLEIARMRQ
jgi:hypothetical protein